MRYAIVENGKVVNVAVAEQALNESWIQSDGAQIGHLYNGQDFSEPSKTLEEAKSEKIAELNNAYASAIYADIEQNGKTYRADEAGQNLLGKILAVGSVPAGMYWRDTNGTKNSMTFADLQALAGAILARGLAADEKLDTKRAAVDAAATLSEIEAITWEG